jgi:hypothetical protein
LYARKVPVAIAARANRIQVPPEIWETSVRVLRARTRAEDTAMVITINAANNPEYRNSLCMSRVRANSRIRMVGFTRAS